MQAKCFCSCEPAIDLGLVQVVWKLVQKLLAQLGSGDPAEMQATRIASGRKFADDSVLIVVLGANLVTCLSLLRQQLEPCWNAGPGAGGWYLGWIHFNKNAKSADALSANWIPLLPPIGEIDGEPNLATILCVCSVLYVDIHGTGKFGFVWLAAKRQQTMVMFIMVNLDKHMQQQSFYCPNKNGRSIKCCHPLLSYLSMKCWRNRCLCK